MKKVKNFLVSIFKIILKTLSWVVSAILIFWVIVSAIISILIASPFKLLLKNHKQFNISNLILFIFLTLISIIFYPIGYIYEHIGSGLGQNLSKYYSNVIDYHDEVSNVVLNKLLNKFLIKNDSNKKFGIKGNKSSEILIENFYNRNLMFAGVFLAFILYLFSDKNYD